MGCCQKKLLEHFELAREEESCIQIKEAALPFLNFKIYQLDAAIRKNQFEGQLSVSQLRKTLGDLGVDVLTLLEESDSLNSFFSIFKNDKQQYQAFEITVAGVLLSESSAEDKAKVLFSVFSDVRYAKNENSAITGKLTSVKVRKMLETMFSVATGKLPRLAIDSGQDSRASTPNEEKINSYIAQLEKTKAKFVERTMEQLIRKASDISIEEFVRRISEEESLESILFSSSLRNSLLAI
jgi:hypothetical protein